MIEVGYLNKLLTNISWRNFGFWNSLPLMMSTTVGLKILLDGNIEINTLLTILMIVNQIQECLDWIPYAISLSMEAFVGFKRIEKYLKSTEVDPSYRQELKNNLAIQIEKGTFSWGHNIQNDAEDQSESSDHSPSDFQIVLQDIDLTIEKGKLVGVIGEIGAGKSSFLNACMNNLLMHSEGSVKVDGKIAYVSQNSWIQNKTLKDNILFHNEYNHERYEEVLRVCELNKDLENLEAGDMTEIGEKGINLSGGQKARVAIARAVYADADIILLDDPISALDAHVGKSVMKNCFVKFLNGKTRVLVTHAMQYLKYCDEVIYFDKGSIVWKGSNEDLKKQTFFKKLVGGNRKESVESLEEILESQVLRTENIKLVCKKERKKVD